MIHSSKVVVLSTQHLEDHQRLIHTSTAKYFFLVLESTQQVKLWMDHSTHLAVKLILI